ncbi:MAG TPA: hypothetical protein VGM78_15655, partial [Ilumatobacteraceae bacterium]
MDADAKIGATLATLGVPPATDTFWRELHEHLVAEASRSTDSHGCEPREEVAQAAPMGAVWATISRVRPRRTWRAGVPSKSTGADVVVRLQSDRQPDASRLRVVVLVAAVVAMLAAGLVWIG